VQQLELKVLAEVLKEWGLGLRPRAVVEWVERLGQGKAYLL
jgi:hypothetical protein